MNVHEYQAKELMRKFGIKVLSGHVAKSVDEAVSAAAIIQKYNPRQVLIFGCDPKNLGIRIQLTDYQPIKFQGIEFLKADSLNRIRTDRENNDKRRAGALWVALKEIFG